ncbi:MAG: serine/threonine-protein kinase [Myxococcales bacterium]
MPAEALPKLDRYRLVRRLAAGGMAEVYLGHRVGPSGFQKRVAIKFLMPHLAADEGFLEMFLDEARLVAMLHHPNLVQIFDVGTIDGRVCMVMEYVDGASLSQVHRQAAAAGAGRVPPDVACALLAQACEGLESAHEFKSPETGASLGFVHRDISPHNLLLARDGLLEVADFGIAKSTTNVHVTTANELKGKLSYMAPEQILRSSVDRRVDVWALGAVLFELCAGRRLFTAENEPLLIRAVLEAPLDGPLAELPEPIVPVVRRALARDPEQRTATAGELGRQLGEILALHGGSLERNRVARWAAPYFPPKQPEEITPSMPPPAEQEEVVSLSSGDIELVTGAPLARPRWRRRAAFAAAFALVSIATLALLWKRPSAAPERPDTATAAAPPIPTPTVAPAATATPPAIATPTPPATAAPTRPPTPAPVAIPSPKPAATRKPHAKAVHAAASRHPAHKAAPAAVDAADADSEDDDVGLVNPFHK